MGSGISTDKNTEYHDLISYTTTPILTPADLYTVEAKLKEARLELAELEQRISTLEHQRDKIGEEIIKKYMITTRK